MARIPFSGLDGQAAAGTIGVGVPDTYQRLQADPAAFGGAAAAAATKLGGSLEQAGGTGIEIATREQQFENRARVTEARNTYQAIATAVQHGDENTPDMPGFYSMKAGQATAAFKGQVELLQGALTNAREGLANDAQREAFDREVGSQHVAVLGKMAEHNSNERMAYAKGAQLGSIQLGQTAAENAYQSPALVAEHLGRVQKDQAELDAMMGLSPEAAAANQAKVTSDTLSRIVLRGTGDNALVGKGLLDTFKDRIDPVTYAKLVEHLEPLVERKQGDDLIARRTGQINGQPGQLTSDGTLSSVVHQLETGGSMAPGQGGDGGKAYGPMQVHAEALQDVNKRLGTSYTPEQIKADPALGKKAGDTYLQMMRERYGRDDYALGAYNQGPGAMDAAIKSGRGVAGLPGGGPQYVANGLRLLGQGSGTSSRAYAIGDSLAAGVKQANGTDGGGVVGANPDAILDTINGIKPDAIRGRSVVLSTGLSNDPSKLEVVQQQFDSLKARNVGNVTVLGVGSRPDLAPLNDKLRDLAQKNGAVFQPIQAGPDGVHPASYKGLGMPAAPVGGGRPPVPSVDELMTWADENTQGMSLAGRERVKHGLLSFRSTELQRRAGDTAQFHQTFGNTVAALADGRDVPPVPEERIRAVATTPEQANEMLEQQQIAQTTGQMKTTMAFASPGERAQILQATATGVGNAGRATIGPAKDGVVAPDAGTGDTVDGYKRRQMMLAAGERAAADIDKRLAADPATYVSTAPTVKPLFQAASAPNATADDRAAAVIASLTAQEYMGVPEDKRRALPVNQVEAMVHQLKTVDPSKADMGTALNAMAAGYGVAWPQVFGSMVRHGLPAEYQALAAMGPEPGKPDVWQSDRADFQRGLAMVSGPKGREELETAAGKAATKEIKDGLDAKLMDFKASTLGASNGADQYNRARSALETHALYLAYRGETPGGALEKAYQAQFGKKYDFDGYMRVPKGMMDDVKAATSLEIARLTVEDMPVLFSSTPGLADDQKQAQALSAVRNRPMWVMMPDDGGLRLMVRGFDNQPVTFKRADGNPVEVRFDHLQQFGPEAPGAAVAKQGMRGAGGFMLPQAKDRPASDPNDLGPIARWWRGW